MKIFMRYKYYNEGFERINGIEAADVAAAVNLLTAETAKFVHARGRLVIVEARRIDGPMTIQSPGGQSE